MKKQDNYTLSGESKIEYYDIAFIGDAYVGKTTLLTDNISLKYNPTEGVNCITELPVKYCGALKKNIYDISGCSDFVYVRERYLKNMDIYVMVFDLTNMYSYSNIFEWYNNCKSDIENENSKYLLVGNKCDKIRIVPENIIKTFCERNKINYIETSATQKINVIELFTMIDNIIVNSIKKKKCCICM